MTTLVLSTNNLRFVNLFENLAKVLNVPFEKKCTHEHFQNTHKALDEEKNEHTYKNHKYRRKLTK